MNWPWTDNLLLREQLAKAEARAEKSEAALTAERENRMRDVRHVLSAWLRHEKAFPLPKTLEEETKTEEKQEQPVLLTDVQLAMRDANRKEAARHGISQEDADRDFEKYMSEMMEQ